MTLSLSNTRTCSVSLFQTHLHPSLSLSKTHTHKLSLSPSHTLSKLTMTQTLYIHSLVLHLSQTQACTEDISFVLSYSNSFSVIWLVCVMNPTLQQIYRWEKTPFSAKSVSNSFLKFGPHQTRHFRTQYCDKKTLR
jgi:hypothetical protein